MENIILIQKAGHRPDVHAALDNAFDWFLCAYVFITVFLPGGSIYGINFKYPLYLGLLPLAVYSVFRRKQATVGQLVLLLTVPTILSCWIVLGLCHGFDILSAARQYTDILLTLLLCWLVLLFCNREEARRLRFLRLVLNAVIATAILKIGLIAYAVIRGIPVVDMVFMLGKVFGMDLMTMDLGAMFGRVQFISDELIPLCIFIVLRHRDRLKIGKLGASLSVLLLLASVLFSFSRYFWGFTAFAFVLGLLLGKRDKFQAVLILILGVSVLASLPALIALYELRFSTEVAGGSDSQRTDQISALKDFFVAAPIFGHGLGSYTTQNIRGGTKAQRASYEVQLVALPAQIGLIGVTFFIALGGYYYNKLWWQSSLNLPDRLGICLLLGFWIAAGITNPLLFHPLAGINYATLATLSEIPSKRARSRL